MDLQKAFDATCKVLFGQELGRLQDFAPYLEEMMLPCQVKKSCVSGKDVSVSLFFYPQQARYISQDEIGNFKLPPLNVNEIKDIDSLFEAVSERAVYCGNKQFGRNYEVAEVDNCVDSSAVFRAHNIFNVKYCAYSSYMRESEHVFGATGFPGSAFSMRIMEGVGANRCFETFYGKDLSQMYYSFNCIGCQDCIFAFNLRSKRNIIGNLQLAKDEYARVSQKLFSEMAEELLRKKRLFSIADIAFAGRDGRSIPEEKMAFDSPVPERVERAFRSTTKLVLGQERGGIGGYGPWLLSNAMQVKKIKGALGSPTYKIEGLPIVGKLPADRLVTLKEGLELSQKRAISLAPGEEPSLQGLLERVAKIAYFSVEFVDGQNDNCIDTPTVFTGSNVYKLWDTTNSKNSAYSTGVIESEYVFGGYLRILRSQFCINCYDSTSLKGCFELDGSYSSRDSYFCHNCENISDCMFCFNSKSLQYAVGNTVVGKEQYLRVKKILLDHINSELSAKKSLGIGIFSMPSGKTGTPVVKNRE